MSGHSKIYTKTGDSGETSLVDGSRIGKNDARLDLYGDVDELNSWVGKALTTYLDQESDATTKQQMEKIQSLLFNLGSQLACPDEKLEQMKLPQITIESVQEVEAEIDRIDQILPPLKAFILPGGTAAAADLHVCRAIARRVERKLVHFLSGHNQLSENYQTALQFLNRLSDYLFILSRYANHQKGEAETHWNKS